MKKRSFWRILVRTSVLDYGIAKGLACKIDLYVMEDWLDGLGAILGVEVSAETADGTSVPMHREDCTTSPSACPTAEWRLIFAFSRFGGLRCPSEHVALRLDEVDWERARFLVHSPKTEHHEGKATRWVPIPPELRPYLDEVFHLAAAKK